MIDLYCERSAPGLFEEPLNLLSNLAFFVAAYLIARKLVRANHRATLLWLLPLGIMLTGIGSMAFHLFASSLTQKLDVGAILLFQLSALWIYWRRVLMFGAFASVLVLVLFLGLVVLGLMFNDRLLGSAIYVPSLLLLAGISAANRCGRLSSPGLMDVALLGFALAVVMRSLDSFACGVVPVGTHFMWHLLSAMVAFFISQWLMLNTKKG